MRLIVLPRRLAAHCAIPLFAAAAMQASLAAGPALAHADLGPASGSQVSGTVVISAMGGADSGVGGSVTSDMTDKLGVHLEVTVTGLTPGAHGFHVHEVGDCSAPDASSAKGHFNPTGQPHPNHAGDLPNLNADAKGNARLSLNVPVLVLGDSPNSIIGRSFIINANPDDFRSQPGGNAGARVACGVIQES